MPQGERLRVWNGELRRTSGGLTKEDLIKNKRGKIVSKKKSEAAKKNKDNNLGDWLRTKGDHFLSKGLKKENIKRKGKPGRKAFKKSEEEAPPKLKAPPKQAAPKLTLGQLLASRKRGKKGPPKITKAAPIKPGEKPKNFDRTKVSIANIVTRPKRVRKKRIIHNVGS